MSGSGNASNILDFGATAPSNGQTYNTAISNLGSTFTYTPPLNAGDPISFKVGLTDFAGTYTGYVTGDGSPIILSTTLKTYNEHGGPYYVLESASGITSVTAQSQATFCFAAGTWIAAPDGPVAIEALRPGDLVETALGQGPRKVLWIGHRRLIPDTLPNPATANPIRIAADAFGPNLPMRDLRVSPEHAIYTDGVLIPARHLVNGTSITQEAVDEIEYFHIELATHDVVFAENLPAETWLETGNRTWFDNASVVTLRPEFTPTNTAKACAPIIHEGPILETVRARLNARATNLDVITRNTRIAAIDAGRTLVTIPADTNLITLVPPATAPSDSDSRRLGAAITSLRLDGAELDLAGPCLTLGWHCIEADNGAQWRWTENEATLEITPAPYPRRLEVNVTAVAA
eukprot:gene6589-6658_t